MSIHEELTSVLCDAEGKCCVSGSSTDRDIIDKALAALAALEGNTDNEEDDDEEEDYPPCLYCGEPQCDCDML